MKNLSVVIIGLLIAAPALAQDQQVDRRFDRPSCTSWSGGLGSSNTFTQCDPVTPVVIEKERVIEKRVPVPTPVPVIKEVPVKPKKQ